MSGADGSIKAMIYRNGKGLKVVSCFWDWDDDDETQLKFTIYVERPEDF